MKHERDLDMKDQQMLERRKQQKLLQSTALEAQHKIVVKKKI